MVDSDSLGSWPAQRRPASGFCARIIWPAVLLAACSRLSDYAAPQGRIVDPAELSNADVIAYRTLSREDFRARDLPAQANPYARKIGALTCARISTTPDTGFVSREERNASGTVRIQARVDRLAFVALMDRSCSWWNPVDALPQAYVLEHEQIHFAITELGARALSAEAPALMQELSFTGSSQEEVQRLVRQALEEVIQKAMDELVERHRRFDEETSGVYDPKRQREWFERVMRELEGSEG